MRFNRTDDERGAIIPLVALSTVVIMIIAATAIHGANQEQGNAQWQAWNDGALIAGNACLTLATDDEPCSLDDASRAAKESFELNSGFGTDFWQDCEDPDRDADWETAPADHALNNTCISFNFNEPANRWQARVRLPNTTVETPFASVMGISEINVESEARALSGYESPEVVEERPVIIKNEAWCEYRFQWHYNDCKDWFNVTTLQDKWASMCVNWAKGNKPWRAYHSYWNKNIKIRDENGTVIERIPVGCSNAIPGSRKTDWTADFCQSTRDEDQLELVYKNNRLYSLCHNHNDEFWTEEGRDYYNPPAEEPPVDDDEGGGIIDIS